jgi:asparagine synthetase B (glutamine-hydrolysing)
MNRDALELVMQTGGEIYNRTVFPRGGYVRMAFPSNGKRYSVDKLELKNLLEEAVSRGIGNHDEIGLLLSGGVDSSLLLHLVRELHPDVRVIAYHTDFGVPERSERLDAIEMAAHENVKLRVIDVHSSKQISYIDESLRMMKTVSYGAPSVYMIFDAMRKDGINVAFNALGLDELMAGYTIHKRYFNRGRLNFWPFMRTENRPLKYLMYKYGNAKSFMLSNTLADPAISFVQDTSLEASEFYKFMKAQTLWDTIQYWTYVAMEGNFASLIKRGAWAHGIKVVFPYMDYPLMRYCHNIVPEEKLNKAPVRWLMRNEYNIPERIVRKGENWDKIGWGGTPLPYFSDGMYMAAISTNEDAIHEWFTKEAIDKYYGGNRQTLQMLLFTKLLEVLE